MKKFNEEIVTEQNELLECAGIDCLYALLNMSVSDLIRLVGDYEIDLLLARLLIELEYGGYIRIYQTVPIDKKVGNQFVSDTFEVNDFLYCRDWFYEITVEEFLKLEDLTPSNIPYLTYYLKAYVENGIMYKPENCELCDDEYSNYLSYINMEAV